MTVPSPQDAELYVDRLPPDRDASEDAGYIITANVDGHDLYVYLCAYTIRSRGKGIWLIPDGRIHGTIFFAIPEGERGMMSDNRFVRTGWHLDQYLEPSDHAIEIGEKKSHWKMDGRTYEWTEDEWRVSGEHGGVAVDLTFRPAGDAEWRWGPFEKIVEQDSAGYKAPALVSGTIKVENGREFRLQDAYATCERAAVGQSRDIVAELANDAEIVAIEMRAPGTELQVHEHRGRGMQAATLIARDRRVDFGPWVEGSSVSIEATEHWQDPRSGLRVPVQWKVALEHSEASAEITIKASGRSWFHYNTNGGVMLMMQMIATCDGSIRWADGSIMSIEQAIAGIRWGRALLFARETLAGADL